MKKILIPLALFGVFYAITHAQHGRPGTEHALSTSSAETALPSAPMNLGCTANALPSRWDEARLVLNFSANGRMLLATRGDSASQLWAWTRTADGFSLQPRGAVKSGGTIVSAADSQSTSTLTIDKAASSSAEGDSRFEMTLNLSTQKGTKAVSLGCIAVKQG